MSEDADDWPPLNTLVTVSGVGWDGDLPSRVEGEDDDADLLVLAAPFDAGGPMPVPILPEVGSRVRVTWTHGRGRSEMPAEVLATEGGTTPRWRVEALDDARLIQRRDHVRVDVLLPLQLRGAGTVLTATTSDLSEGGFRAVVRQEVGFAAGEQLEVVIELGDDDPVSSTAQLLRTTALPTGCTAVTGRFLQLARRDADRIRKHLFAHQARQRAIARDGA